MTCQTVFNLIRDKKSLVTCDALQVNDVPWDVCMTNNKSSERERNFFSCDSSVMRTLCHMQLSPNNCNTRRGKVGSPVIRTNVL